MGLKLARAGPGLGQTFTVWVGPGPGLGLNSSLRAWAGPGLKDCCGPGPGLDPAVSPGLEPRRTKYNSSVDIDPSYRRTARSRRMMVNSVTPAPREDLKSPGWKAQIVLFTQDTTLHGIRYVTGSDTRYLFRRVFWALALVATVSIFIFYCYDRVSTFLEFKKTVNVEVNYINSLEFPAVTVCNQNSLRLTAAVQGGWYDKLEQLQPPTPDDSHIECQQGQFPCRSNDECVSKEYLCDMFPDCRDGSDESHTQCGLCKRIRVNANEDIRRKHDDVIGFNYELQPHSLFNNKTVYLKISELGVTDFIYLYYDGTAARWTFARDVVGNMLGYMTGGQAASADALNKTTTWTFKRGGSTMNDVRLTMTCDISLDSPPPIQKLAKSPAPTSLSLEQLYKKGAHQRNDMIEKCTWKGQRCDQNSFRSRFTDLGLCLTFEPPSKVEKAGPGSALQMSFNAEKYEYTKDTQSGVGIQVLFHDRRDEPIMKEKSFALSAGLYSLVAVEKTTVQNAEPPWGTCGRKELDYYDFYSFATCRMDCANILVRDGCECRALNMPKATQDYDICGIDKQVQCAAPKLDEFFKYGNFCVCTTPCTEDLFVASVSFSSMSVNLESISGAAKVKMGKLQSRLETAREITFRINAGLYRQTMRRFSRVTDELNTNYQFLQTLGRTLTDQVAASEKRVIEVNKDCIWFTSKQRLLVETLRTSLLWAIERFYTHVHDNVYVALLELPDVMKRTMDQYDGTPVTQKEYKQRLLSDYLQSIHDPLAEAVAVAKGQLTVDLKQAINTLLYDNDYVLRTGYVSQLLTYVQNLNCDWCLSDDESLTSLLKSRLIGYINAEMTASLDSIKSDLDRYGTILRDAQFVKMDRTGRNNFVDGVNKTTVEVGKLLIGLNETLREKVVGAAATVGEMHALLTPKCRGELQSASRELGAVHLRIMAFVNDMKEQLLRFYKTYTGYQQDYQNVTTTLKKTFEGVEFDSLTRFVRARLSVIDSLLNDLSLADNKLKTQIDAINYWLVAQARDAYIAAYSQYWAKFQLETTDLHEAHERRRRFLDRRGAGGRHRLRAQRHESEYLLGATGGHRHCTAGGVRRCRRTSGQ
ncbi:hypothetical protein LSAT2_022904 [Lamellibrachia satsuma]|nr:hypothetical protein LSAT2_022904 [Lamellibrachia satsuma]